VASVRPLLLVVLLAAMPATATEPLEARRAAVTAVASELQALEAAQQARRDELGALGRRLEVLKATSRGRLLPGGELDAALKRSQELSSVMTGLARQVADRTAALERARLALVEGLTEALARGRADFEVAGREARVALIARLRQLRAEREAVRAALPGARLPAVEALKASDDPEELLEQADRLRDGQERARQELASLARRLAERRQEAELDRRVQRFLGEESMFDDQDRRLRAQRAAGSSVELMGTVGGGATGATGAGATPAAGSPDVRDPGAAVSAVDARPQPGGPTSLFADDDGVADLERQRAALERVAQDLATRAAGLERRASQLR
jgi:hypothetical protein